MRKPKNKSKNITNGDLESVESSVVNDTWARNASSGGQQSNVDKKDSSSTSLLKVLFDDRNLTWFCIVVFFFHFGNAAVLPLLSQRLALDNSREGIPYTVVNIAIAQLFSVAGVKAMDFFTNRDYRINVPILIGFSLLIPRILIIFLLLKYWPNSYALVATQVFDGIGAGINGLALMKVTKVLTYGSNRFGVAFALANLSEALGAAMSNLLSGYVVTVYGYEEGFLFLLVPAVLSPILIFKVRVEVPDEKNYSTNDLPDDTDVEDANDDEISLPVDVISFKR